MESPSCSAFCRSLGETLPPKIKAPFCRRKGQPKGKQIGHLKGRLKGFIDADRQRKDNDVTLRKFVQVIAAKFGGEKLGKMFQKKSFDTKSLLGKLFGKCCLGGDLRPRHQSRYWGISCSQRPPPWETKKDKDTLSYENLQIWLKDGLEGLESEKRGLPASKILV